MTLRVRPTWGLFITFAILGFLLATQLRVQDGLPGDLEARSLEELTALVGHLNQETDRLQEEWADLSLRLMSGRYTGESDVSMIAEQKRMLEELRVVTGVVPAQGPGVRLTVHDVNGELEAYDLTQLINELRSAGGEAVVVNGLRAGLRTAFGNASDGMTLSGVPLTLPYTIEVVGSPSDLISSLVMAGGVVPSLEQRPGVKVEIQSVDSVSAPPAQTNPRFIYAAKAE
ncbi:MAG: DUF881 domain-containing protein [Thermoleophilia bacterium]|nr:DUF881 domain-containing protein [Thermoleophilia bacterium]